MRARSRRRRASAAGRRLGGGCDAAAARRGLADLLPTLQQPVLGICLGMQLLFERSAEGATECLGILPRTVRRLQAAPGRPVPHMGWNQLHTSAADPLLEGIAPRRVLLFRAQLRRTGVRGDARQRATTARRSRPWCRRGNFWGTQFHPERSAAAGARLLANFLS